MSSTVTVTLPAPTSAGDLVILSVGWGGLATTVVSVSDNIGSTYVNGLGPANWSASFREQIFYVSNVAAGVTSIKVNLSALPTTFLEARVYEYSGIVKSGPLDTATFQTGLAGTTLDSGPATITNTNELIFGLGQQSIVGNTLTPGSGFTQRPVANGGGMLAEEMIVGPAGSYNSTEVVAPAADWIMEQLTFKAGQ